jgi:hypothetical protein
VQSLSFKRRSETYRTPLHIPVVLHQRQYSSRCNAELIRNVSSRSARENEISRANPTSTSTSPHPITSNHRSHTPSHSVVSTVNLFAHLLKNQPHPIPSAALQQKAQNPGSNKENRETKTHTLKVLIIDSHLIRLLTSLCGPFKSQLKASISLSSQSLRSTGGLRRLPLAIYWARVASSETGKDSTTGAIFAGPCWKTGGKRPG